MPRREFLAGALAATLLSPSFQSAGGQNITDREITVEDLASAERIAGLSFSEDERKAILPSVRSALRGFQALRAQPITYQDEPPTIFRPIGKVPSYQPGISARLHSTKPALPEKAEDLAFAPVGQLARLIQERQLLPSTLTRLYVDRLKAFGDKLLCVVTLTEDIAIEQAKQADEEIVRGAYRGPLHGIPYGLKDLFATKGIRTTWGAEPYRDQVFDYDATVTKKLREAGAILVAKLSLGALAQGDVWFKGRTKNPWNPAQGSSGSSAGSACATAAGLVGFSVGTETLGSIMSPCHQCRVTGLRPTYGRVSRYGAMAVSWTMDKIGPIGRTAEDCALVLAAMAGSDHRDRTCVDMPFHWPPDLDMSKLKIGYLIGPNDDPSDRTRLDKDDYLRLLASFGARLEPIKFDPAPAGINNILGVEAAAAFDDFTRSAKINELENSSWPNTYRSNRFVPAVEYLQAQRARTILMRRFEETFADFDMFVANERGGYTLLMTNLTGHPQVLIPFGTTNTGAPRSISLVGRLYDEQRLLAVAWEIQKATTFHLARPDLSQL